MSFYDRAISIRIKSRGRLLLTRTTSIRYGLNESTVGTKADEIGEPKRIRNKKRGRNKFLIGRNTFSRLQCRNGITKGPYRFYGL